MPKIFSVLRHEFKLTAANKAFVILTILGPFLILAMTVLPALLTNRPGAMNTGKPVFVAGASPAVFDTLAAGFSGMGVEARRAEDENEAKKAVLDGRAAGFLALSQGWPDEGSALWYSKTGAEAVLFGSAETLLAKTAREIRIAASGIDSARVARILAAPDFKVIKLNADGKEETKNEETFMQVLFTTMAFIMMLYMTVLLYGQMIGRSVVTEKTSKTVEIMLSSVTSRDLMFGKILGLGLAGILQYGIWVSMAMILVKFIGPLLNLAMPPALSLGNLAWLVLFFVLAFFLYASAYAALGAASEDEHHLGQIAWPLLMFLMIPLIMISALVTNSESALSVALSFFPLTSPIVMMIRVLVATPPLWQILLCIAILAASVAGMALLAAKVFRIGILMTGKRPALKEILHWIAVK